MSISDEQVTAGVLWETMPSGPPRALAQAAAEEFGLRGYHATTTRHIAARAGMSPAGLYVHYPSKAELLFTIAEIGHRSVLELLRSVTERPLPPDQMLHDVVRNFVIWHAENNTVARVLQYELISLEGDHFAIIAAIRRETRSLIARCLADFQLSPEQATMIRRAIMSLGIDTARWFDRTKSLSPEALGRGYANLIMSLVQTPDR